MSVGLTLFHSKLWEKVDVEKNYINNGFNLITDVCTMENFVDLIEKKEKLTIFYTPLQLILEESNLSAMEIDESIRIWYERHTKIFQYYKAHSERIEIIDISLLNNNKAATEISKKYGIDFNEQQSVDCEIRKLTSHALLCLYPNEYSLSKELQKLDNSLASDQLSQKDHILNIYESALKKLYLSKNKFETETSNNLERKYKLKNMKVLEENDALNRCLLDSYTSLGSLMKRYEYKVKDIKLSKIKAMESQKALRSLEVAAISQQYRALTLKYNNLNQNLFVKALTKVKKFIAKVIGKEDVLTKVKKAEIDVLKSSAYFDLEYYRRNNKDVMESGVDPYLHYIDFGYLEGRKPSSSFDGTRYLLKYKDVAKSGINPLIHYIKYGRDEGREI